MVQGHVPADLLPPTQIPSFIAPLPPVQPNARQQPPPPPPLEPPPKEEESPQTSQPVAQQAQPEPSVPSQQSLPSTHRCPDVGPTAPMTQEYVPPGGAQQVPMTPNACLHGGTARVPVGPTSPPVYPGGMQAGSPPRVLPSPPPPVVQAMGDGSAWSYTRQMHRSSPHAAQAVEVQALPTSAGVTEPSLYQHSAAPPAYQWATGSAAGASTSHSYAGAYPAMAVNTGSGGVDGSGGVGSQPNTQPPTQPRLEQPISKNKSPLPKLNIKEGDPTTLTRVINEWIQKTSIALNTWSLVRLQTSGLSLSTLPDNNTIGGCLLPLKTELLT